MAAERGSRAVPVVMLRENLEGVPEAALPAPYSIRRYREGDEESWRRIHLQADLYNEITPRLFVEQFGRDVEALTERQYYLCNEEGTAVGTATAWFNVRFPEKNWGRVHWVAIVASLQGKGLAKPLLSACLQGMRVLGHDGAYLDTSSVRIPAINLYLRYGFVPHVASAEDVQAWRQTAGEVKEEFRSVIEDVIEAAIAR